MSNFVVINLADPGGIGAIASLRQGVTAKQRRTGLGRVLYGQHAVDQVDAFALLAADQNHTLQRTDPGLQALRQLCVRSKKIYLATHGVPTDVDHAFANAAGGVPLCTARELARFMLMALPQRDEAYNIALVMCYGARTATYRSAQLDHQGMVPINDLRTSFAYKFFRDVARSRHLRMTARTGAVAFDAATGRSTVEQEMSIDARIDKDILVRQPHVVPLTQANRALEVQAAQGGNGTYDAFRNLSNQFRNDPNRVANNADEQTIKDYQGLMRDRQQYVDIMDAHGDLAKYGKLVFTYVGGTLTIINKYGVNGGIAPNTTLYQGLMT